MKSVNYIVRQISCKKAKEYIIKHHYSHGCHNAPSPCFGLFDNNKLIGVLMFACPCSENVRASVFGDKYKDNVTELHRLHILDVTPKNTESWFIVRCLKLLKELKPQIEAVISFSDTTIGHNGTIYKATNAYRAGTTSKTVFYIDSNGRLRHPRQQGINITLEMAQNKGWEPVERDSKNRYLYLLAFDKRDAKRIKARCKITIKDGFPIICTNAKQGLTLF